MPLRYCEERFPVMGTTAHVGLVGGSEHDLATAQTRLAALERRWSRFLPDSELSKLNARAGVPVIVSTETYQLIAAAIDAWQQTGGSFDPTIGTTMVAAGYDRSFVGGMPTEPRGHGQRLAAPGPGEIVLHPYGPAVHLPPGVKLDFGGLAKGWAADLVSAEVITDHSHNPVTGCMINIGGDVRVSGTPPRSQGWVVSLDCPGAPVTRTVAITEGAVCTSTKTKRRWTSQNGPEHHLRDPRTGAPMETGIASVTIVAARAAQAEVLTKAAFSAGPGGAGDLVSATGATGLMVLDDGTVVDFDGLTQFLVPAEQSDGDLAVV